MDKGVKIILADDHSIVRNGIRSLLENEPEFEIVAEASTGTEALEMVKKLVPDILISDINMPEMSGIEVTEKIVNNGIKTRVLILSMYTDESLILRSVEAGVMGYIPKGADYKEIANAVKSLAENKMYYNQDITKILTQSIIRAKKIKQEMEQLEELTRREKEVLKKIVEGHSNKVIAEELFISSRTVDTHRTNIMKKLRARNTADLVRKAIQNDLI